MSCKFVQGKGFNAFHCTVNPLGGPSFEIAEPEKECKHLKTFENRGILTCQDCGFIRNETTLNWEYNAEN